MKLSIVTSLVGLTDGERAWDVESFVRECRAADEAGVYAAYTGERRGRGPASGRNAGSSSPNSLCMFGLANTERLRFGSHVTLLPLHHPVTVVQDACVINTLYPGRFRLGVGAGYTDDDFRAYGISKRERGVRTEAGLKAIQNFLNGNLVELDPPLRGVVPERDPAMGDSPLEVYVGAWSKPGVLRAARYSDGWYTGPIRTVTAEAQLAELYRAECERLGKTPHVVLLREAALGVTDDAARDELGSYLLDYARIYYERGDTYDPVLDPWMKDVRTVDDITLDMVLPDRFLCGSVDTWLETLSSWNDLIAPDEIMVRLRYYYGPSVDVSIGAIGTIGREVIPVIDDW
jgi:alkanesulfonate monooxygenase SsuD/methylene tetrahydromethanopterin reductase-like flavin-dependent oxidoreductase (luciferase family)